MLQPACLLPVKPQLRHPDCQTGHTQFGMRERVQYTGSISS